MRKKIYYKEIDGKVVFFYQSINNGRRKTNI